MSTERPPTNYKRLFFLLFGVTLLVTAALCYNTWRLKKTEAALDSSTFHDPYDLAALRDHNYPFTVTNNGFTYKGITGNYIDEHVLAFGGYENDMLYFMRDYIGATAQKESAMIDVGANVGQHSLFMSRHVRMVHSFEPYPPVIARFREMIRLNGFDNIAIHEVGLGEKAGLIPFYSPADNNLGGGTFRKEFALMEKREVLDKMRIVVGDEWLKSIELPPVSIIKIDVEGFEEPVLKGLKQTLQHHRPLVIVEISQPPMGTIVTTEQLQSLFPEKYQFLYLERHRDLDRLAKGKYELKELLPDPTRFLKTRIQIDVVAFPEEKDKQVPRERPG